MEGIKQELFELWQDIANGFRKAWKNWLCEAGFHQGDKITEPHEHKSNVSIKYCSLCGGIIDEIEDEQGVSWTSEAN
ncbi:hypothetical protein GWN26_04550 [Candidatus Saccharibacteria bacterium]|nr:hypothetical protein [Candidatus Saccharibacteria bacterium]NIV03503.1 hypothetical protein [Calditrichia bacterium]NIS38048.1 hypothetical protein [Candidatus Saccharibacteria bacterium]NIV71745.1 hypothetical protein [Calditrichia bacterium]NIV98443.1 hypothetical protein [Candidatus Saccharibacteria bacterium]